MGSEWKVTSQGFEDFCPLFIIMQRGKLQISGTTTEEDAKGLISEDFVKWCSVRNWEWGAVFRTFLIWMQYLNLLVTCWHLPAQHPCLGRTAWLKMQEDLWVQDAGLLCTSTALNAEPNPARLCPPWPASPGQFFPAPRLWQLQDRVLSCGHFSAVSSTWLEVGQNATGFARGK